MNVNKYIGHEGQIYGVEELRLVGGKGDGMRLLQVRNGSGLELTISLDRCADISRLSVEGCNFGYFSPCGYVSPKYYDKNGLNFLKSFTAGFLTTCGLTCAGNPCVDAGENLPLHGTVSNIPAESFCHFIIDDEIHIRVVIRDAAIFAHKLILEREYIIPLFKNELTVNDRIVNCGSLETPIQMLYHFNVGYPLLDENTVLKTNAVSIKPRNAHAAEDMEDCLKMEIPQVGYEEKCYYHRFSEKAEVSLFNERLGKGLCMSYDANNLKFFTQWKMMAEQDYVLGIEPANCLPDGRDVMRQMGELEMLEAGKYRCFSIHFDFLSK